eukprot:6916499-Pyramimonas_sp.AAC.1
MMNTFVVAVKSASRKSELVCGVFWPMQVYEQREGHALPASLVTSHIHNGKEMKGVFRNEDEFGCPPG